MGTAANPWRWGLLEFKPYIQYRKHRSNIPTVYVCLMMISLAFEN